MIPEEKSPSPNDGQQLGAHEIQPEEKPTLGHKFADAITSGMGSWKFVIGQSLFLATWIGLNSTALVPKWDPNLTLLNLGLSCEAAFAGAFILMSQNRQAEKDRLTLHKDYHVDMSAERTVQDINRKLDFLLAALPPEKLEEMMKAAAASRAPAAQGTTSNDNAPVPAAKPAAPPKFG